MVSVNPGINFTTINMQIHITVNENDTAKSLIFSGMISAMMRYARFRMAKDDENIANEKHKRGINLTSSTLQPFDFIKTNSAKPIKPIAAPIVDNMKRICGERKTFL